ncbi:ferritin family protein [Candidatus Omnitrophota bacterium]
MKIEERGNELIIIDFDELEAYKIARKIENEGINFYKKLVANAKDEEVKKKFQFLLNEEYKHLEFFEERIKALNSEEEGFEEDDLLTCFDYGIFQPYKAIHDLPEHIDDVKKSLRLGLIVEENSVKFYQQCYAQVTSDKVKTELLIIAEEEMQHRKLIEKIIEDL